MLWPIIYWPPVANRYDDGGISGGHLDRPALKRLMNDIAAGRVDRIVVYKIDRLTRSLTDFAKLVETLDGVGASFVSVTQAFNTATSMGRLTLNLLLSFAQFEREVTVERIRDKIAASKKKGLWMGGNVPLGYEPVDRALRIVPEEAEAVRMLYDLYEELGTVTADTKAAVQLGMRSKLRTGRDGVQRGGSIMGRGQFHHVLSNPVYAGRIRHKEQVHEGQHEAIIEPARWECVQVRLMDRSAKPRNKPARAHPSPLAGKLFDETGDRLTPSDASKGSKRYRNYVSQRLVTGKGNADDGTGWRLPAERLERDLGRSVSTPLIGCIERGGIASTDAHSIRRYQDAVRTLGAKILQCIRSARLGDGILAIDLDSAEIAKALAVKDKHLAPQMFNLQLPFTQRRRGVEVRMILGAPQPTRDEVLIANIARAEQWRLALRSGDSLATIAVRDGMPVKYLGEMLRFAFVSPKLVRSILEGNQPPALTTNWLRRHDLTASWVEQDRIVAQL